jgi:hypothetical protein
MGLTIYQMSRNRFLSSSSGSTVAPRPANVAEMLLESGAPRRADFNPRGASASLSERSQSAAVGARLKPHAD